ncbi:3-hydroxyacyl-CoA dehydrogenase NAD-binding domain-containing protein [Streptomyces aureus]|uniref:3-hydroxyacyl-CoA dehydrogenase NAD-binding domain-containing protein n=1 Tax=Streptomyces aureus TaxID=193461 RepID=A0ABV4SQR8_9ACTN
MVEDPEAILTSNTSSILIMKLAGAAGRPDQVMGTHFFNPVRAMPLVELVGSRHTSDASMDRAESWVAQTPWASSRSAPRTGPASSSTRCWCRICCPPCA